MAPPAHGLSIDTAIAMPDDELTIRLFAALQRVNDDDAGDELRDELYFLAGELVERFAPDAARAELEHTYRDSDPFDLAEAIVALRRRQAARQLRQLLGSENDG